MGTRGLTVVIKGGETKVAQYGQWDHYPSGQGLTVLRFLRDPLKLEALRMQVESIPDVTPEDWAKIEREAGLEPGAQFMTMEQAGKIEKAYPEMTRETGAEILDLIASGKARFLKRESYPITEDDAIWIEGQFVVDLDEGHFLTIWGGESTFYQFDDLPTDEAYVTATEGDDDED